MPKTAIGYWRIRRGEKAYVSGRSPFTDSGSNTTWVGWIEGCGPYAWDDDCRVWRLGEHPCDLIAPWTDPEPDPWDYQPQPGDDVWVLYKSGDFETWSVVGPLWKYRLDALKEAGVRFAKAEPPQVKGAGE